MMEFLKKRLGVYSITDGENGVDGVLLSLQEWEQYKQDKTQLRQNDAAIGELRDENKKLRRENRDDAETIGMYIDEVKKAQRRLDDAQKRVAQAETNAEAERRKNGNLTRIIREKSNKARNIKGRKSPGDIVTQTAELPLIYKKERLGRPWQSVIETPWPSEMSIQAVKEEHDIEAWFTLPDDMNAPEARRQAQAAERYAQTGQPAAYEVRWRTNKKGVWEAQVSHFGNVQCGDAAVWAEQNEVE